MKKLTDVMNKLYNTTDETTLKGTDYTVESLLGLLHTFDKPLEDMTPQEKMYEQIKNGIVRALVAASNETL